MNPINVKSLSDNFATAFQPNKTGLMPLHHSVIDGNSALTNARHPGYQSLERNYTF